MRKQMLGSTAPGMGRETANWLDLDPIARVEVTSEDPRYPIEAAFSREGGDGWKAGVRGEQTIRLIFEPARSVKRIRLRFIETAVPRTQEFTLRWRPERDAWSREIVRQQWNFAPAGSTTEIEDYSVNLPHVAVLELVVNPDLNRRDSFATLAEWRVA